MNKLNELRDREDGFTLIELLIVVLIIGILAAIAIPVYLGLQDTARKAATQQVVNSAVTTVQVGLTEGLDVATAQAAVPATQGDTAVTFGSTTSFTTVTGTNSKVSGGYTYTYNAATSEFTAGTL